MPKPAAKSGAKPPAKPWTVLVYLAGDNNLDGNGVKDLAEMKKVGSGPALNIVAQFDRAAAKRTTSRYLLRKGGTIAKDVVKRLGETNTGDPKTLLDFITWGIDTYPAQRYLVVLWNHGQGWDDTDIYAGERRATARLARPGRVRHALFRTSVQKVAKAAAKGGGTARAILLDDNAKDFLDNLEMKAVFAAVKKKLGRKLDLMGMDACLMSMAEVGYQVRDSVATTVGSEQTEPVDGWPYHTILAALAKTPTMTGADLAKVVVANYVDSYRKTSEAVTQSACNLAQADALAAAVTALAKALTDGLANPATLLSIFRVRSQVQSYEVEDNIDLVDFCRLLRPLGVSAAIAAACDAVAAAVNGPNGFVTSSETFGAAMAHSNGVAIYFPTRSVSPLYAGLDFAKTTKWGDFLSAFIAAIHRRP